jgi:branched-chain amino acid transport system substrate-binding protein
MRLKRYFIATAMGIFLCLPFRVHAGDAITFGVSVGLTGKYAEMGEMQKKAYLLWEQLTNRNGGLLNKKVKLIIENDGSDKNTARKIYKRFIEKDRLDFVFGPYSSGLTDAVMPVAEKNGSPHRRRRWLRHVMA